jgi:hypothetical protein
MGTINHSQKEKVMKKFLYQEFWWAIHNLIAHPLMQLLHWLSLCGLIKSIDDFGERLHNWTMPAETAPVDEEKDIPIALGAVIIHRWFADGAGWAYHPTYGDHRLRIVKVLGDELSNQRQKLEAGNGRHRFVRMIEEGVLLGEVVDDLACPDPMAAGRHPTILRAVLLQGKPSKDYQERWLKHLARLDPPYPGTNYSLMIHMDDVNGGDKFHALGDHHDDYHHGCL